MWKRAVLFRARREDADMDSAPDVAGFAAAPPIPQPVSPQAFTTQVRFFAAPLRLFI